jgi:CopZ-like zinc binding protein
MEPMNKAFVKEPDSNAPANCPRCGSLGIAVGEATLGAQLPSDALRDISPEAFFCPFPKCVVVYFDAYERTINVDRLPKPVYPKDPDAPICGCFGFTRDDIEQDLNEGGVRRVRELLAKAKGPEARCSVMSASGQCCAGEVQRYYMKRRAESTQS